MKAQLEQYIRAVPDFPEQGIVFRDMSPLLEQAFEPTIRTLAAMLPVTLWQQIDAIVGIESRGFLLASALAVKQNKGLLLARKKGKLPPPTISYPYQLEYGEDCLEMRSATQPKNVLVVDDVLATGGTLNACCHLTEKAGHHILATLVLINLKDLNQFNWQDTPQFALFEY